MEKKLFLILSLIITPVINALDQNTNSKSKFAQIKITIENSWLNRPRCMYKQHPNPTKFGGTLVTAGTIGMLCTFIAPKDSLPITERPLSAGLLLVGIIVLSTTYCFTDDKTDKTPQQPDEKNNENC